jgi:acetyltransferase-like isoleucine patch superfamily enzyme
MSIDIKSNKEMHSVKNYILHGIYLGLYGFVKYWSLPLSNYLRYFVIKIFAPNIRTATISDGVLIWFPWNVEIDENSSLNQGVIINGYGGVRIGRGVRIAAYTCVHSVDHQHDDPDMFIVDQGYIAAPVIIEDDVWIGAGVHITKGVKIGKGSVIGAGSVVTTNIPPYSIAVGVPCRVIKTRSTVDAAGLTDKKMNR